ncbi:E3 ubiquitin-protein ligase TRIM71-like [Stylophora pistillata]|uniref:E3 ubiquitin-protein ligase TRIM71-like n=1 Tax=Stylophora pistillata TaxID=50429 RepID=UPI000C04FB54|nr:E3 ubiquitin-protein ligase TRIM71-like [Stylophora pistillata]
MDIKTLLHNLREEVSCPVCTNIYTDPKHLPCLHSFCLQCLKQWHRTSHGRDTIRCPKCQVVSRVPDNGDLKDLPTSFYLNGLIDVLAIKECKTSQVGCGNCQKKSSKCSYCFHCCMFWCDECLIGHNIIQGNKDHRVVALEDFQEKDYEDVIKRPLYCSKQRHEKEELKYFCKNCETAACQSCVLIDHAGHAITHLEEEAEKQKLEMKSLIETQRRDLQAKINTMGRLTEDCAKLIQLSKDIKREVQTFVDNLIATIEAKKQNIFTAVDDETKRFLEALTTQKTETESEIKIIEESLEKAETILRRSTNVDVLQGKKSLEKIFQGADESQSKDYCYPERLPVLVFVENSKIVNTINAEEIGTLQMENRTKASQSAADGKGLEEAIANREAHFTLTTRNAKGRQCYDERDHVTVGIMDEQGRDCARDLRITDNKDGRYQVSYSPRNEGRCKLTIKVNGENVGGSQFLVLVKTFQFKPVLSFGEEGSSLGKFDLPWGVAVNARDEIAVTDQNNHRVQIFSSEGKFLRSFGKKGDKAGELRKPRGIAFHNNGNIFVADSANDRIQIFSGEGEYVGSFGGKGNLDSQLNNPLGLSVDSDGNIIVADSINRLIKIFSPGGKFLRKIGEQGSLTFPFHCIQYDRYLIVSERGEHCIKVFDRNGNFLYTFGKQGGGDGEINNPRCLSVNKSGQLMVCDECNHRIQVFELNGKFVGKFGTRGENSGEFDTPWAIAALSTGRAVVVEFGNQRIQIIE